MRQTLASCETDPHYPPSLLSCKYVFGTVEETWLKCDFIVNGPALLSHTKTGFNIDPRSLPPSPNSSCTSAERALLCAWDTVQQMGEGVSGLGCGLGQAAIRRQREYNHKEFALSGESFRCWFSIKLKALDDSGNISWFQFSLNLKRE